MLLRPLRPSSSLNVPKMSCTVWGFRFSESYTCRQLRALWGVPSLLIFCWMCFGKFPWPVGRCCSYLLPKQALATRLEKDNKISLMKGRPTLYVQYTWSWLSPPCASARAASASGWGTLSKMSLVEEDEEDPVPKAALRGPLQSTPVSHLNNKAHLWVVPTSPLFTYRQYSASCSLW